MREEHCWERLCALSACDRSLTAVLELSQQMKCKFIDGDDLHPSSNVEKMSKGIPLTDGDRVAWLNSIHHQLCEYDGQPKPFKRTSHGTAIDGTHKVHTAW